MYIYIIFFCFHFVVKGYDSSSSEFKYIDLLSETEKKEFMEIVARRILSEIKPIGPPKETFIELTDDELNKNSNYVNTILKEESLKFESTRTTHMEDRNSTGNTVAIKRDGADKDETATEFMEKYDKLQEIQANYVNVEIDKNNTEDDEAIYKSEKSELPSNFNLPNFGNATGDLLRTYVDLTLRRKKRVRRNNDDSEKSNSEKSKNNYYEQVSIEPVLNTTEQQAQTEEPNSSSITETKQLLHNFEGSNDYKATPISVIQNVHQTKVLTNTDAFVEKTDQNKNFDLVVPADSENNKTTLFETAIEEHVNTNLENDKNKKPDPEESKNNNYEQVSLKPVSNTTEQQAQSNSSSTIQTKQLLDNFEGSYDNKATTISVKQNLNYGEVLTNASAVVETEDENNNLHLSKLADSENNKTTLFETATEDRVYTNQNKSNDKVISVADLNTTSSIETSVAPANQTEENNTATAFRSLYSLTDKTKKSKEAKPIDNQQYENLIKDIPPTRFLEILKTKYVETLPPELGHVEEQIPKSVLIKDNNLSPLDQSLQRYDVFEVEPDKSSLNLRTANTNQEAPHYTPIHDYAPENAFFNALNRLGPSSDVQDHNVFQVENDQFFLRSDSKNNNQGEPNFAPVHSYEPANAYFNPQNGLGPNYDNEEQSKNSVYRRTDENVPVNHFSEDYYYLRSGKDNSNINRKLDFGIKKKQKDQKLKAVSVEIPVYMKKLKTTGPEDYVDMDYFFGRSRTDKKYREVNNFVSKLPSLEIGLKNNLKTKLKRERIKSRIDLVSQILKELEEEEKTSRSGHGFAADYYWGRIASGSIENEPKYTNLRSNNQKENSKNILRNKIKEAKDFILDLQVFGNNYVDYDELPTKDAYFKENKDVKILSTNKKSAEREVELSEINEKLIIEALEKIIKGLITLLPPAQIKKLKNFKPSASKEAIYNELLPFIKSADTKKDDDMKNPKNSEENEKKFLELVKKIVENILSRIPPETIEKLKKLKDSSKETILKELLSLTQMDDTKQDNDIIKPKGSQEINENTLNPIENKENNDDTLKPKDNQETEDKIISEDNLPSNNDNNEQNVDLESKIQTRKRKKKFLRALELDFQIEPFVEALKNLIINESEGLKKYNWLGTTVDLQAALNKLIDLTESDNDENIDPNDKYLLQYMQFLYESAQEVITADPNQKLKIDNPYLFNLTMQRVKSRLPRNFKKKHYKPRDAIQMLNAIYRFTRIVLAEEAAPGSGKKINKSNREELQQFLVDLRSGLSQFHNALKHISQVTKYENQRWYKNLKELYLGRPKRKQFLEILLHLFSIRLFDLIEESSKNGLKQDVISYVLNNKDVVRKTKDELVFVIKLLNEIKKIDGVIK